MMGAQAGTECPVIAQLELTQQILIPDQHQGEGGSLGRLSPRSKRSSPSVLCELFCAWPK